MIIDAALDVVDREGLDALTIRGLAQVLGVGQMTIYGYVRTKDEIVDLLGVRVLGELGGAEQGDGPWQQRLGDAFRRIRVTMLRHPAVGAYLLSAHATHGPQLDQVRDSLIAVMLDAGFSPQRAVDGIAVLTSYVIGFVEAESVRARRHPDEEDLSHLRHLDQVRYPHLTSVWDTWIQRTSARTFEVGLGLLIDGLARDPRGEGSG